MKNNNKIAIVSASLGLGGAERFASLLGLMLTNLGYEVHNIIILNEVNYQVYGKLYNLGEICQNDNVVFRKIKKGILLKKYLTENKIEYVIDNRSRPTIIREIFTQWVYNKLKVFYMVHISKVQMYLSPSVFFSKIVYKNAVKIVCVSKSIEQLVNVKYQIKNTKTIYNPLVFQDFNAEKPNNLPEKYFIFFGRLEENQKNFTLLLESFQQSQAIKQGYHLIIMGDGPSKDNLIAKIKKMFLIEYVQVLPFHEDVFPYVCHARASLLTSRFEGFPMSIIESLAVGTPVISVDCETGPKEIIQNNFNGLLVENNNENALAEAIKKMIEDEKLYQTCKNNAQKSVEHLSLTTIAQQWKQLLSEK